MFIFTTLFLFVGGLVGDRVRLAAENLALRQQLVVLKRAAPRPKIRRFDRILWVRVSRLWAEWRAVLVVVRPETLVRWHRQGFRPFWRWKSKRSPLGRPRVAAEIRDRIRRMAAETPL